MLEALLDTARIAWRSGKKINFVSDDLGRTMLSVDDDFANNQHGVFVGNTAKDNKNLAEAKSLLQAAMQGDKVKMSEAVSVLNSDSLVDIRKTLELGEDTIEQRRQAAEKANRESQEAMSKQASEVEQMKMQQEDALNKRDNDTKLQIAFSKLGEGTEDGNDNDISDHLDNRKLDLDRQKHVDILNLQERRRKDEVSKSAKELGLKKEEIAVKRMAAKNKPKPSK